MADQNRKEYGVPVNWSWSQLLQGIGAIETFEYKNSRCDLVAGTGKNEKQYVRLQIDLEGYIYLYNIYRRPKGYFPLY